ncbi:Transposon TX1 uncharacterized 149 kDa protein ORF 2 [Takifugu flavidus]|uniref:Transposon TX1 uncharacterized 149 kDa protein ORF 2 n=1 Tax=Takifugu flavidus TaxID=433684 RepID=A0A5C6PCA3_9TELE|nr:Transposon TX1 uncharacterized 149 kDa protein ORF 2 [Takifugu flavidus]
MGTLNVNGARDARKQALVFDTAKRKRIDVLFLQETHSDCGIEADWEKEWEGQVLLSHNTTLSGGVGLLFSRGFTPSSLEVEHVWWDRGKVEMQLLCQQYTLNATQDTRRSIKDLEMEIVELEAIGSSTGDRGCIETLQSKKMFLASLLDSQQGVLYLPREEGGQGLIHLASRTAAFRIQFVQRFLTGPADLMWRDVARCVFRRSVVKAWALFKVEKRTSSESLHWLLREPTVHGARLDVSAEAPPRLTAALWRTRTLLLQHVVAVAGPDLTGAEAVGSLLGIRSTQAAEGVLRLWRNRLSTRERRILEDYGQGTEPDSEDPFPEIRLVAHLGNLDGPLLRPAKTFSLVAVDKKTLYNDCVRVLNRRGLSNRSTSIWADRLGGDGARPCWRVLYKPPLKKRTGDLQWRILHGAVALNALLSRMNTAVSDQCPFCSGRETVFHAYIPWQEYDFGPGHLEKIMDKKDHTNTKGGWKKKMGSSKKKDWIGLN